MTGQENNFLHCGSCVSFLHAFLNPKWSPSILGNVLALLSFCYAIWPGIFFFFFPFKVCRQVFLRSRCVLVRLSAGGIICFCSPLVACASGLSDSLKTLELFTKKL